MAQPTTTFLDELVAAGRGCVALLIGNRQAASFFDFSQRGLVGSFIALVISIAVQAFGPSLLGHPPSAGVSSGTVILGSLVIAIQFGVAWAVLRALGRGDGFVPFLVALNWAALFEAFLALGVIGIFGEPFQMLPSGELAFASGTMPFAVLGIGALVVAVNVARLIVTLRPGHAALFIGAQFLAALVSPLVLGSLI